MSRRTSIARCRGCGARIVFFTSPFTGRPRAFDPTPVDMGRQLTRRAYPVENDTTAWKYLDLVEALMMRLGCGRAEAEEEARQLPWHTPHDCNEEEGTR